MDSYLKRNGYKNTSSDPCVHIKSKKKIDGRITFIIIGLYVDDVLLFSNRVSLLRKEKKKEV